MMIFREKPGVISPDSVWVGISDYYMYTHRHLIGLVWTMMREWNHDKHLVG